MPPKGMQRRMPTIHSNTLFHFTNESGLLGILRSNFRTSFVRERLTTEKGAHWDYRIPAICFCDIPLHLLTDHIAQYGQYGLGLSRDWALAKQLNPVFYYQSNSLLFREFSSMMSLQHEDVMALHKEKMPIASISSAYFRNRYILQYYKPWYGYDFKLGKEKYFYDEREWRYVPINEGIIEAIYNDDDEFQKEKDEYYSELKNPELIFEPKDINYIVLKDESERYEISQNIRSIKEKFSYRDVETLSTKILTVEQIQNDL